jgi:large conductance mechanosensitive channel
VIVALVIFIVLKKLMKFIVKENPPVNEPTTKACPECLSTIPIKAKRCAHCAIPIPTPA